MAIFIGHRVSNKVLEKHIRVYLHSYIQAFDASFVRWYSLFMFPSSKIKTALVLYSGGRDSSATALEMARLGYMVKLFTCQWGLSELVGPRGDSAPDIRHAELMGAFPKYIDPGNYLLVSRDCPSLWVRAVTRRRTLGTQSSWGLSRNISTLIAQSW